MKDKQVRGKYEQAFKMEAVRQVTAAHGRYAINGDGSEYDDDVGGPTCAAGRDGVDLESLSAEQDATTKDAARNLFDQIQRTAAPTHRR